MIITMDLDGCVFNWAKAFIGYTNTKYNYNDNYKLFFKWDFFNQKDVSLTKEEFFKSYDEFNNYRMWQCLEVYPKAKDALCSIHSMGNEIIYLTSRPKNSEMSTLKSILNNGLPINGILFTSEKDIVAKNLGAKIGVDDKPSTILRYGKIGIIPVKVSHYYNTEPSHESELVINDLEQLVKIVRQMS